MKTTSLLKIIQQVDKNKVLIIGIPAALSLPAYDLITRGVTSFQVLVFATISCGLMWLARNLRGQWMTIVGVVGTMATAIYGQSLVGERITLLEILPLITIQIIAIATPAPKSRGYEHAHLIIEAKEEGERIIPTPAPPPPNVL